MPSSLEPEDRAERWYANLCGKTLMQVREDLEDTGERTPDLTNEKIQQAVAAIPEIDDGRLFVCDTPGCCHEAEDEGLFVE